VPQAKIQDAELRQAHDSTQATGGNLGAAVQVDVLDVLHALGDDVQTSIGEPTALADVEGLEVVEGLGDLADTLVADLAGRQRQGLKVEQSLGDVHESLIADLVAEGHVERGDATTALSQISHTDVGDVVARAQVELAQTRHPSQMLDAGVGDTHAKGQIDGLEGGETERDMPERLVAQSLTVL